jgi:ferredoxin
MRSLRSLAGRDAGAVGHAVDRRPVIGQRQPAAVEGEGGTENGAAAAEAPAVVEQTEFTVVLTSGGDKIKDCIQCGTCSGICPFGYIMKFPPGKIIGALAYAWSFAKRPIAGERMMKLAVLIIPPQTSTLAEIMDRVRILCSVYDPISGKYRTNYALYFEIAGFISFMIFMIWVAWNFMRSRRSDKIQSG